MGIKTYVYLIFMQSIWKIHEIPIFSFVNLLTATIVVRYLNQRSNTFFLGYGRRLLNLCFLFSIQGDLSDEVQPLKIGHLQWLGADLLIFATLDITGSTSCLHVAEINNAKKEIFVKDCLEVDMYVISISVNQKTGTVVLQLKDGTLLKYLRGKFKGCDAMY